MSALDHLETAETAIMFFIAQTGVDSDDPFPDAVPMLLAVMRSISRAAGILESGAESWGSVHEEAADA